MDSKQKGMSLVEVLVSLLIISLMILGLLRFTDAAFSMSKRNMDKQFATQKAISMLEELKSLVQVQGESASLLDAYDDGTAFNAVLTTDPKITNPADPVSANASLGADQWKYVRQVSVTPLPGTMAPDVRLVRVRVCMNRDTDHNGQPDALAEIAGVVRTPAGNYPPTQVYDVYALAVENVPGWWVYMDNLIPFVQSAIQNLQTRNPGMELRVHWITKLSYGRDQQYRPQINSAVDSRQPIEKVYFYPGKLPAGEAVDYYYPPNNFKGHVLVDATDANGYDAVNNPHPYALADNYNNAMRYPDELALFNARVASGQEQDDAPTLRILLERLYQNPERFRNAIFINLHGELFPFPPIRNYSDPAKDPANYPSIRVVTHPERLKHPSGVAVKLRVYSYIADPGQVHLGSLSPDWLGQGLSSPPPIAVTLKDVDWDPVSGAGAIVAIAGGTDQDGTLGADAYQRSAATTTSSGAAMYYRVAHNGSDTVLLLYNSPLKSPEAGDVVGGACSPTGSCTGLNANSRLYGLEYIPAPAEDFTSGSPAEFGVDLTTAHLTSSGACTGVDCEPNTARWVITIPADRLPGGAGGNGVLRVETAIAPPSASATTAPSNLSTTYAWRGSDLWLFGDGTAANPPHLPITETYQVIGDPRHNPYADLKKPHAGSGYTQQDRVGLGYNRYFDDFEGPGPVNKAGAPYWKGYTYTVAGQNYGVKNDLAVGNDGWDTHIGYVEVDLNRVYQIMRTALTKAHAVYTSMTGYSFYYVGLGGEIGYDTANNFPNSIPIDNKLFTGVSGSAFEQSILPGAGAGVKYIRENTTAGSYWWGLYWLGELYPDSAYSGGLGWAATGNLPTGVGAGRFVRVTRDSIGVNLPPGTKFINTGRRTGPPGSTSYFWTGSAGSTFHHSPSDGTGNLQAGGLEIASRYSYPLSNGIPINRPFACNVNATGDNPDHFLQPPYGPTFNSGYLSLFYNHSVRAGDEGSALLSVADSNNNSNNVQFVAVNGISMTGESGSSFMANWSMLTLMHGFFAAGLYNPMNSYSNHVRQLPRITITAPDLSTDLRDPASVTVGWSREWRRWDGQPYTASYPVGYAETSALSYAVMYSADNGVTWKYMQDNSAARPGVRPADTSRLISTTAPNPTYSWATSPSVFPRGTYLIRVEAYRDDLPLHYAYHQLRLFIRRS